MTTLVPRPPYTQEELRALYPANLELQLVQVLLRHGERSPVSARFQNTGLPAFWPYCSVVRQMKSAVRESSHPSSDSTSSSSDPHQFSTLQWKRRLETFHPATDEPVLASGPRGELDSICDMGMLTDKGRQTTFDLGRRLRSLYVDQLGFLPEALSHDRDIDSLYLRATPIPRALDSLQETLAGLYPRATRAAGLAAPTILVRAPADETLFPNDSNCRRFAALSRAFAQRAADHWNATDEMAYLTRLWGKWMPPARGTDDAVQPVAVDSRPRLSGIMDTVNATLAHGPETRLPREFYDQKARDIVAKIAVEEWFAGYRESREYRMLGIGGLMGDVVGRMVGSAEQTTADGEYEVARGALGGTKDQSTSTSTPIRFGLSGCHDTTLAAILASLGAFGTEKWPPFTSHVAIEMFRKKTPTTTTTDAPAPAPAPTSTPAPAPITASSAKASWFGSLFSWGPSTTANKPGNPPPGGIGRKRSEQLTPTERAKLEGYYVRLRFNDEVVTVPGCRAAGNHLEGDESFCTLAAFKAIVDKYVPVNWKQQCRQDITAPAFPAEPEPAGY